MAVGGSQSRQATVRSDQNRDLVVLRGGGGPVALLRCRCHCWPAS